MAKQQSSECGGGRVSSFQPQAVLSAWKEVVWNKMMEMGQARRGVVDETCCEWIDFYGA